MALALLSLALSLAGRQGATPQFVQFKAKLYSLDTRGHAPVVISSQFGFIKIFKDIMLLCK